MQPNANFFGQDHIANINYVYYMPMNGCIPSNVQYTEAQTSADYLEEN